MSLEKVQIPSERPIFPTPAGLITTVDTDDKANIITLGEIYNLSIRKPVIVGLGIAPQRYSHRLLCGCREFVVNLPPTTVWARGASTSGRSAGSWTILISVAGFSSNQNILAALFPITQPIGNTSKPFFPRRGDSAQV
jgi:flavin reductase (DIM6/NTAB) family NADH-FMN oxidoreductase RutF